MLTFDDDVNEAFNDWNRQATMFGNDDEKRGVSVTASMMYQLQSALLKLVEAAQREMLDLQEGRGGDENEGLRQLIAGLEQTIRDRDTNIAALQATVANLMDNELAQYDEPEGEPAVGGRLKRSKVVRKSMPIHWFDGRQSRRPPGARSAAEEAGIERRFEHYTRNPPPPPPTYV